MNIGTGVLDLASAATDKTVYCVPNAKLVWEEDVTDAQQLPRMLVYPQAEEMAAGDIILSITMDGKTYELALPHQLKTNADYAWTAGQNYLYTLNMNGYGFGANDEDGKDDIDVTITAWQDNETVAGDMNKPIN